MTRLSEIQIHIARMDELLDIVGAMRSLAGMRVQEAQHALPGIRSYAASMATGISSALLLCRNPRRTPIGPVAARSFCALPSMALSAASMNTCSRRPRQRSNRLIYCLCWAAAAPRLPPSEAEGRVDETYGDPSCRSAGCG